MNNQWILNENECMEYNVKDKWMYGIERQGWMNEWNRTLRMNERKKRWEDECPGKIDEWMDVPEGWIDEWINVPEGWIDEWMNKCPGRMNRWMNEWISPPRMSFVGMAMGCSLFQSYWRACSSHPGSCSQLSSSDAWSTFRL